MRLATLRNGRPDGELVVVSADGTRYLASPGMSLLAVMADWAHAEPVQHMGKALQHRFSSALPMCCTKAVAVFWTQPALSPPCRVRGNGWMDRPLPTMAI